MGVSGVGKSTTIHFLAGNKLAFGILKSGISHIGPVDIKPETASIFTSPHTYSITKFIQSVDI